MSNGVLNMLHTNTRECLPKRRDSAKECEECEKGDAQNDERDVPKEAHFLEMQNKQRADPRNISASEVLVRRRHQIDHMKKDLPPGSYSFKYVDRCLRAGKLLDLEEFRAGPARGAIRPVGSTSVPAKGRRTGYTAKDDQILYDWVKPIEKSGGAIRGNKIYQQLEELHPQHTYQSWRDRYLRVVKDRPRPVAKGDTAGAAAATDPPTPPSSSIRDEPALNPSEAAPDSNPLHRLSHFRIQKQMGSFARHPKSWISTQLERTNFGMKWKNYFHAFVRPKHVARSRAKKESAQKSSPALSTKGDRQAPHTERSPIAQKQMSNVTEPTHKSAKRTFRESDASSEERLRDNKKKRRTITGGSTRASPKTPENSNNSRKQIIDYLDEPTVSKRAVRYEVSEAPSQPASPPVVITIEDDTDDDTQTRQKSTEPILSGALTSAEPVPTSSNTSQPNELYETAPQVQPTQDIFADPSQYMDDLSNLLRPTLPSIPEGAQSNSQAMTEEEKEEIQELDQWIESRLKTGRAKDEEQIIQALSYTSMNPYLADMVLDRLKEGSDVPTDIPGIWTEEEDRLLETGNGYDVQKLQEKHGAEYFDIRGQYLMTLRQVVGLEE
ncbi:predicted protein [Uncinocarpus reesii 1704]|uniref:DNA-binding protein RAP1 n=1 Tax=Uncinocarpus reesii (strain UAMH 1704) TaxID=336963 RepID=C4JGW7_UNCRE|nr:uncharacterized protein UREG_01218 [Uncinocarpus reesii 1704]EEP76369.1 predicted protein [Uncinocarpus reesii 1704]